MVGPTLSGQEGLTVDVWFDDGLSTQRRGRNYVFLWRCQLSGGCWYGGSSGTLGPRSLFPLCNLTKTRKLRKGERTGRMNMRWKETYTPGVNRTVEIQIGLTSCTFSPLERNFPVKEYLRSVSTRVVGYKRSRRGLEGRRIQRLESYRSTPKVGDDLVWRSTTTVLEDSERTFPVHTSVGVRDLVSTPSSFKCKGVSPRGSSLEMILKGRSWRRSVYFIVPKVYKRNSNVS